ncbi:putative Dual specificity protein kinase YAK1 [Blattamonas nauphoetae]|uniref:Dual specificity protein kinase YAK1 n=1 Tax=Blattamonas nauphoetae TaxID=2049346 RepID=A0ABQ9XMY0_9EUKA|nr:putative Dual specificity protein kinase YAK1 [Blattamonas nauphoetae]
MSKAFLDLTSKTRERSASLSVLPMARILHSHSFIKKSTVYLNELYQHCEPSKWFTRISRIAHTVLTTPSERSPNNRLDNVHGDLIVSSGDVLCAHGLNSTYQGRKYVVEVLLGKGSFGQVFRCVNPESFHSYAVKVIKNHPAYNKQALLEKRILSMLRDQDPDTVHCVRLIDDFVCQGHICFVTELLGDDLYKVLKQGRFRGFSIPLISNIGKQLLETCCFARALGIIHCDLKPENILIDGYLPKVKTIDFGSATLENHTVFTYIQSRYYRAPEILLGLPYTSQIDTWSVGCIVAELFLGRPLFPGQSEYDQIRRISLMLGNPPQEMLMKGKSSGKFCVIDPSISGRIRIATVPEFAKKSGEMFQPRQYNYLSESIEKTINGYATHLKMENPRSLRAAANREPLIDFLTTILVADPSMRPTPHQMLQHPFITGDEWSPGWVPPSDEDARAIFHALQAASRLKPPKAYPSKHRHPHLKRSQHSPFRLFNDPSHPQLSDAPKGGRPHSLSCSCVSASISLSQLDSVSVHSSPSLTPLIAPSTNSLSSGSGEHLTNSQMPSDGVSLRSRQLKIRPSPLTHLQRSVLDGDDDNRSSSPQKKSRLTKTFIAHFNDDSTALGSAPPTMVNKPDFTSPLHNRTLPFLSPDSLDSPHAGLRSPKKRNRQPDADRTTLTRAALNKTLPPLNLGGPTQPKSSTSFLPPLQTSPVVKDHHTQKRSSVPDNPSRLRASVASVNVRASYGSSPLASRKR